MEVWFADEARVGQENKTTRRRAKRGTRPAAPHDRRAASTCIFGAVRPEDGKAAGLVLPHRDIGAMDLHLAEISAAAAPGAHAVLPLDRAGWRMSAEVAVPPDITSVPLPPKRPELDVMENVRRFMRDNWPSNRVFPSGEAIVDHCCHAWNRLVDRPWRIMSIGLRDWAHRF